MADSLQDQLRALGLATGDSKRTRGKQRSGQPPEHKRSRKRDRAQRHDPEPSLGEAYALREQEEQRQARQARQQRQQEERRRRRINQAIREIVSAQRQNREDADIARHFLFNGRIRKIYVTAEQQNALNGSRLGIVYLSGGYHLLEPDALEAVRHISAEHVIDIGTDRGSDDDLHPVPEDLSW